MVSYKYVILGGGNAAGYAAKEFKEHAVGDVSSASPLAPSFCMTMAVTRTKF